MNACWFLWDSLDLICVKIPGKEVICIHIASLKDGKIPVHSLMIFNLLQSYRRAIVTSKIRVNAIYYLRANSVCTRYATFWKKNVTVIVLF